MKFELTNETKIVNGIKLCRIKALVSFGDIKAGEQGGWLERERGLSQEGNAWVYGDARVYGNAQVSGNARVSGDAWEKSPLYIQGTKAAITNCKHGHIAIGCQAHTFEKWRKDYKKIGKEYGYSDAQIKEYGAIIALICKIGR